MLSTTTPSTEQLFAQGCKQHEAGRLGEAEAFYTEALRHDKSFHPAWFQLGVLATSVHKLPEAITLIQRASACAPQEFTYPRALCEIHRRLGQLDQAIHHGTQATTLNPNDADSFYNLGLALFDAQRFEDAVAAYQRAVAVNPNYGLAYNNLGAAYEQLDDMDAACDAYEKAVDIDPQHHEAQHNLGAIENQRGRLAEARTRYHAAIAANPHFIHAHHSLSTLKQYGPDDAHVQILENLAPQVPSMAPDTQARFWFALGKVRSDLEQHDASFAAYEKANTLHRKTFAYHTDDARREIADVVNRFDQPPRATPHHGCADATPIFVLGMPRSGSTLIEQILDSHSQVTGAGELSDLSELVTEAASSQPGTSYVDWFQRASDEELTQLGERYLKRLRSHSDSAVRIVDKMPGNFFYVGLIHKLFPRARVIHSMRNPWDTCVSNYTQQFKNLMPFAYDLTELGRYCRLCDDMMDHWKASLPSGFIYEARYEDMVDDFETQARALIDFCGLPWEDTCLAFHKNKRVVKTASHAQVVKPVYRSSVHRWKQYENQIAPLIESYEQEPPLVGPALV